MRRGLTLIEITMAIAIFAVLMAAALQGFAGVQGYVDQEGAGNDLLLEGRRVIAEITEDVGNSAWFIPLDADGNGSQRPPTGADAADLDALKVPARDRSLRYYPYVNVQTAAGHGTAFPLHYRPAANVPDVTTYPATLPSEHRSVSQELIFLKVKTGPAGATPAASQPRRVNFSDPVKAIAAYTAYHDGVPSDSVMTASSAFGASRIVTDIPLAWETDKALPDNTNADDLRECTYVVVPNAATGKGRLERRYRNGGDAVAGADGLVTKLDRVVSRYVDRVVFDTYRTSATLNVNQVRVVVYLSRELEKQPGRFQTQRVEATIALRSTVDPQYSLNLGAWLGTGGASAVAP